MARKLYRGDTFTKGYQSIMDIVRMQDFDDPWGTALSNLFALATVAYVEWGAVMSEFRPSPLLRDDGDTLGEWPDAEFQALYREGHITREDVETAYRVLSRYADLIPEDRRY